MVKLMSIHIRSTTSKLHRKKRLLRKDVSSQNTEGRRRGFGAVFVLRPDGFICSLTLMELNAGSAQTVSETFNKLH